MKVAVAAASLLGLALGPIAAVPASDPAIAPASTDPLVVDALAREPAELANAVTPPRQPAPASATTPEPAPPQGAGDGRLHRCIGADGGTIFTDRRCQDLQAQEGVAPGAGAGAHWRGATFRVRSCARSQDDLLFGVRSALEAHDVNRFADYYHWTGMSSAEGYRLLERLNSFSERPLVDVQLSSGRSPESYDMDDYFLLPESIADMPDWSPEPPRPRPRSHLLRVDQMRSDKDLSSQTTYFRLLTNAGCWWLQF